MKEYPVVVYVEAVLMENGEVIHFGKTLGWVNERQKKLIESGANKITRGGEDVVALGESVA